MEVAADVEEGGGDGKEVEDCGLNGGVGGVDGCAVGDYGVVEVAWEGLW